MSPRRGDQYMPAPTVTVNLDRLDVLDAVHRVPKSRPAEHAAVDGDPVWSCRGAQAGGCEQIGGGGGNNDEEWYEEADWLHEPLDPLAIARSGRTRAIDRQIIGQFVERPE